MMKNSKLSLLLLALFATAVTSEYEVPTKKAMPPKMDPIPYVFSTVVKEIGLPPTCS